MQLLRPGGLIGRRNEPTGLYILEGDEIPVVEFSALLKLLKVEELN